ncbi:MAG: Stp1/IreP family PP2C-type Ser/Thr phosphatase [Oscillospiraceae bacterium]|nr:Stp1/IreP family PP2C-type Ser/Thr phosphatase [Oscillospiraceae bacterium]MBQ8731844.1 Stp1/IreP family PP2C-type Ser/Thr phosphatase [Oscillospiraceae bacterium]
MRVYGKSDIGKKRAENQDTFAAELLGENACFGIVCDGMGGAAGGFTASITAQQEILSHIRENFRPELSSNSIRNLLLSAVSAANAVVFEKAEDPTFRGMGTTVVAAIICGETAHIAHVGDSRAYSVADGKAEQITRDHSVVQRLVEMGQLTEDEAKNHPEKNLITRAVGVDSEIEVDYYEVFLKENDFVLLCTDGLSNYVEADDIYKMIQESEESEVVDRLIGEALRKGGSDNITAVLLAC